MNHGATGTAATLFSKSIKAAAAVAAGSASAKSARDTILQEALELHHLQTAANSTLLEYGLNLGFIERRQNDGRLTIEALNAFPLSPSKLVEQLVTELILRLGIFIPATSLIKIAIESNTDDPDREDALRCVYVLSILLHQIVNFDETSMRTLNRVLICVAIILFSLTTTNSKPCQEMESFKRKIRKRLLVDYYLWCLTFAMNLVLTCGSPLYINLEQAHGIEVHMFQLMLSTICVASLSFSMRLIGHGRLAPLINGTPLLFLDAGDGITLAKGSILFICYFSFWCSDWRELVDWNHSMLCEAGICELLNKEPGKLRTKLKKAKHKFDEWRLEEGLDDEGWFILLDTPATATTFRPHANNSSSATNNTNEMRAGGGEDNEDGPPNPTGESGISDSGASDEPGSGAEQEQEQEEGEEEEEEEEEEDEEEAIDEEQDEIDEQQMIDYSERVIYLQSRNPLLTSLAAIMLVVWK